MIFSYQKIIFLTVLSLILFSVVFLCKNYLSKLYPNYNPIQKIHKNYVPPLGGLVIFIVFYFYIYFFLPNTILAKWYIILPSLIIILVGLLEDLFGKASVKIRFFAIFISSLVFIYFTENLPTIEIYFIGKIINDNFFIQIIFYSIGLTALSNGTNMIDGMNGLCGFTILSIIIGLISLMFLNDSFGILFEELIVLAFLIIIFLFINFPFGKIFLGDLGAYWLGWIIGISIIILYSNNNFHTWGAVLLIFYPIIEVVFSTIRKFFMGYSPLKPDNNHLHLKIYKTLKGTNSRRSEFNSFTTLCLMPFWAMPMFGVIWTHYFSHLAIIFIIFFSIIYLFFYFIMPHHD